jgi:thioredoxin reductase (NADPH)
MKRILSIILVFSSLIVQGRILDISDKGILNEPPVAPILIIGSGISGCTAALAAARSKIPTIVISGKEPGGQLMGAALVENMPGVEPKPGYEIVEFIKEQAISKGALFIEDTVVEVDFAEWPFIVKLADRGEIKAYSVIIATGSSPRKLGIPGETEYEGRGVAYCALCDCFMFENKKVAVIGGGDSAIEQAVHLAPYAKEIVIFVRRERMRASQDMQERLEAYANISIDYHTSVREVLGNDETVTHLRVYNHEMEQEIMVPFDGMFLAIGHAPNSQLFAGHIELSSGGYIILPTRSQQITIPGVFVAGDVGEAAVKQVATAAGSSTQAAIEAVHFLQGAGINHKTVYSSKIVQ